MVTSRRALDAYETPPHYVKALIDVIGVPNGSVYEPCVGHGHIVRQLVAAGVRLKNISTNDIDERYGQTHVDAARNAAAWRTYDWAITNPPFSQELPILQRALDYCKNVAFLARLSFLEPTAVGTSRSPARLPFWREYGPQLTDLIMLPRYSFTGTGSDSMTCCWLVFQRREEHGTQIVFSEE